MNRIKLASVLAILLLALVACPRPIEPVDNNEETTTNEENDPGYPWPDEYGKYGPESGPTYRSITHSHALGFFPAELKIAVYENTPYLSIRRTGDSVWFFEEGENKERFDSLCAVHGDTTRNESVEFWYYFFNKGNDSVPALNCRRTYIDDQIVSIDVITEDDYDEEHLRGSSVNDIIEILYTHYDLTEDRFHINERKMLRDITEKDLEYAVDMVYLGYEPPGRNDYKWSTCYWRTEFFFVTRPKARGNRFFFTYTIKMSSGKEYKSAFTCLFR